MIRIGAVRFPAIVLAALTLGAVVVATALSSPAAAELEPDALARARAIRTELNARYRVLPGRKLVVTEVTTTEVVETLTLVTDWLEPRVVPAEDGVYFAICSPRATCPYPARATAWRAHAFLPRRQALELAVRTFLETPARLVVVALPTAEPVWVVFEREVLAELDAPAVLEQFAASSAGLQPPLRKLVDQITRSRLFVPLPIFPPSHDTMCAIRLLGP